LRRLSTQDVETGVTYSLKDGEPDRRRTPLVPLQDSPPCSGSWTGAAESSWYVGYLRRKDHAPLVFALHVEGASFTAINNFRRAFAEQLIADIAHW